MDVLEEDRSDLPREQETELGHNLSHLPLYTQSISLQSTISMLSVFNVPAAFKFTVPGMSSSWAWLRSHRQLTNQIEYFFFKLRHPLQQI